MQPAQKVKGHIEKYRNEFGPLALFGVTADAWTSSSNCSCATCTVHFLDDYVIVSYVLSTKELSESHTATDLRADLLETLIEWNVISTTTTTASMQ